MGSDSGPIWPMKLIASARVAGFSLNRPRTAEVTVSAPGFFTPRIDMQRCSASMTTKTCGVSDVDERVGDLGREPLLHLGPLGEPVDQARQSSTAR